MLKHLAPAIAATVLLVGATVVRADENIPSGQTQTAADPSVDATTPTPTPKIKKTKWHDPAKKTKATAVSTQKKAGPSSQASTDAASRPLTN